MSMPPNLPDVPEITGEELVRRVDAGGDVQLLDVRPAERVLAGRIEVVADADFHNLTNSQLLATPDLSGTGLDPARPVAVVCARGVSSRVAADLLIRAGYDATSVIGGMESWGRLMVGRDLPTGSDLDGLVQFDRLGKGSLAYLLVSDGEAFVVDPPRDAAPIVARAEQAGARIVGVADTHVHADYISGGPRLAASLGVPYYLHPGDETYPFDGRPGRLDSVAVEDGATLRVGRATIEVFHNPGHTLGSVSHLVDGCALSGDFVFVRSIGRPDLAGRTEEWTKDLWQSLERARAAWPDERRVYPGHYSGEDERSDDHTIGSTFGEIRRSNEPIEIADEAEFTAWVAERARPAPDAYRRIKAINIGLQVVTDAEADLLDVGKNECACS